VLTDPTLPAEAKKLLESPLGVLILTFIFQLFTMAYQEHGADVRQEKEQQFIKQFTIIPQGVKIALVILNWSGFAGGCWRDGFKKFSVQGGSFSECGFDAVPQPD
jgi:hypothetical protein